MEIHLVSGIFHLSWQVWFAKSQVDSFAVADIRSNAKLCIPTWVSAKETKNQQVEAPCKYKYLKQTKAIQSVAEIVEGNDIT